MAQIVKNNLSQVTLKFKIQKLNPQYFASSFNSRHIWLIIQTKQKGMTESVSINDICVRANIQAKGQIIHSDLLKQI